MRPQHQNSTKLRPQNGSFRPVTIWGPPDQILDPPLIFGSCREKKGKFYIEQIILLTFLHKCYRKMSCKDLYPQQQCATFQTHISALCMRPNLQEQCLRYLLSNESPVSNFWYLSNESPVSNFSPKINLETYIKQIVRPAMFCCVHFLMSSFFGLL